MIEFDLGVAQTKFLFAAIVERPVEVDIGGILARQARSRIPSQLLKPVFLCFILRRWRRWHPFPGIGAEFFRRQ